MTNLLKWSSNDLIYCQTRPIDNEFNEFLYFFCFE